MTRLKITRRRPLVEAIVAESGARRRARERGEDPDLCPEAIAAQALAERDWMLRRRIGNGAG
ncbi:hypothetical protein [Mycobacterium sp. D16R24]|uniref:hypothetical protein n=1 Tax=Mycobacterium sp. D16R24 TaxID=1855656 RepID=UPI0009945BA6|nr:hypothetical protein [Mycobacterium sp. D16R24]